MRQIRPGMAFHEDNAHTKFWIYKREGQRYVVYPFRYPIAQFAGFKVPVGSFKEAIDEIDYAVNAAKDHL